MTDIKPALTPGRIVLYTLTERETVNPERVGASVPALVLEADPITRKADLAVFVSGIEDLPYSITFDPKARRAPMILAPTILVNGAAEGSEIGCYHFPRGK